MKNGIIILILTLSWGFGQCDANGDGDLDILDILVEVNCILTDCWEVEPSICDGLTEVELWGEYYDIGTTTSIDLGSQGLTGSIPPEIGCLTNLDTLHLGSNQLTGEIPPEIGDLENLTTLSLSSNQLTGEIPSTIGGLENLTYLTLSWNQLSGSIPSEIGNLTNLTYLDLAYNQLTGEIPPEVCDLIESNNWESWWSFSDSILDGNNLINTCEETTDVCEDIDGNVYETIQIGGQLWMAENLKVTHYNDNSEIPTGYSGSEWTQLETDAYAVYPTDDDNASQSTCGDDCADVYGNLYNWYAVDDDRGVCPDGWHVPSDEEFMELEMYLGLSEEEANSTGYRGTDEGSKLAGNSDLWTDGDLVNNSEFGTSGFNILPAGYRFSSNGYYTNMGYSGYFWSSSETSSNYAWYRDLSYYGSNVRRASYYKQYGFSVRCLGD